MKMGKKFAICDDCNQEMIMGGGCTFNVIENNEGEKYDRLPYEKEPEYADVMPDVCHDCNAGLGKYHHFGCDMERCPKCHGQLITCDCNWKLVIYDAERK